MQADYKCGHVCIIGRPNAGKSTLLNRLLGQKISITSKKPQTTRWRLLGIKTEMEYQIVYVDTPGLQMRYNSGMNRHMRKEIMDSLFYIDALIFVLSGMEWSEIEEDILEMIGGIKVPVILAINKIDRIRDKKELLPFIDEMSHKFPFSQIIPVSALKGDNVDHIENSVVPYLPESAPEFPDDMITDKNERFFAAEFIREQLTRILGEELPYKISVTIDQYSERKQVLHILASIWVESDNQKKIIIGKDGKNLKYAGRQSRKEMENMFDKKVFLQSRVKVRKKWSTDEKALKQFGYNS